MSFSALSVVNAALGVLGIGFALLRRGRRGLVSRLMIGSGVVLLLPLGLNFAVYPLLFLGGQRSLYSLSVPVLHCLRWLTWPAYALLLFGFAFLTVARRRAAKETVSPPAAEEPVTGPRHGKLDWEAAGGGVVAAITGGLIGVLLGKAIGGTWSDSAEGEIVLGLMCGVAGAVAGLITGIAGVLHAYRSDAGARRRFWFTVLAAFFGVLLVAPLWQSTAGSLIPERSGGYYYRKCCINFPAGVLPFIAGVLGYLIALLSADPATRSRPAYRRRRLIAGCLLLALVATATLPFFVCGPRQSSSSVRNAPVLPAFLHYPGAKEKRAMELVGPSGSTGALYYFETKDSVAAVLGFYRKALAGWDSLPSSETSGGTRVTYGSRDGKQFVKIFCQATAPPGGWRSLRLFLSPKYHPSFPW